MTSFTVTAQKSAPSISWGPHTGENYWAIVFYYISVTNVKREYIPMDYGNPNMRSVEVSFDGEKADAYSADVQIFINDGEETVIYTIHAIREE